MKLIKKLKSRLNTDKNLLDLFKGGSISFIFQIIGIGLSYLFIFLLSKNYGAEGVGVFALSFTVLNIVVLFGKFGLDVSSVKFIGELSEKKEFGKMKDVYIKILKIAIPVNIILSILLFYVSEYIAIYVFHKEYLILYFQIISFSILPMSLRFIHANSIRGMQNIKIYSFIQNISLYLFSISILFLFIYLNKFDYVFPLYAISISIVIGSLISIYFWLKELNFFTYSIESYLPFKEILSISVPLLLSSSIMLVLGYADTIMLGIFKTEVEVGIYNVSYKVATAGMIIFMALSSINTPKIAAAYGSNKLTDLKKIIFQSRKIIFIATFPLSLFILLFSSKILSLFGDEFISGQISLVLLTIGFFIKSVFGVSEYILQMSNHQKSLILYSSIIAFLNILLNYLLIPLYGINGAAFASMISIVCYQILLSYKVKKEFGIIFSGRFSK